MTSEKSAGSAAPDAAASVTITAQYIKDLSFENPNAPQIFGSNNLPPDISMSVNVQSRQVGEQAYEVVLTMKLDSKLDGKAAFIAELAYAGVFLLPPFSEENLRMFLLVEAPRILFPFARSSLTNAVRDGGFPHVMISPIDFMALYMANKDNIGSMPAAGAA
jgi:preprotein translocase subunit SecB